MKTGVLVAGAGPVGLTMASELARYGLSVDSKSYSFAGFWLRTGFTHYGKRAFRNSGGIFRKSVEREIRTCARGGPEPGKRAPIREGEPAVGSGNTPRFARFAQETPAARALLSKYPDLIEPLARKPYADRGVWVTRPDGYVALTSKHDAWNDVHAYLKRLAKTTTASADSGA
jgi:hypothetical protein